VTRCSRIQTEKSLEGKMKKMELEEKRREVGKERMQK
jgi:hypothetical protein